MEENSGETVSYDIELVDPITREVLLLDEPHHMRGGTFCVGGEQRAHLNVTYNYYIHFQTAFKDPRGIRSIYEMTGAESISVIRDAVTSLNTDVDDDYWKPTEGNARRALTQLLALAQMRPDGVWMGD